MRGGAGPEAGELRRLLSDLVGESGQLLAALDRSTSAAEEAEAEAAAAAAVEAAVEAEAEAEAAAEAAAAAAAAEVPGCAASAPAFACGCTVGGTSSSWAPLAVPIGVVSPRPSRGVTTSPPPPLPFRAW